MTTSTKGVSPLWRSDFLFGPIFDMNFKNFTPGKQVRLFYDSSAEPQKLLKNNTYYL